MILSRRSCYAQADFEKENQGFVDRFREYFPDFTEGHLLDLGCGPGDIPIRFALAFPSCRITGVDASEPMIGLADVAVKQAGLADRITFRCERFQAVSLDRDQSMPQSPTVCCIMCPIPCSFGIGCGNW